MVDYPADVELPRHIGRAVMNWAHLEQATAVTLWVATDVTIGTGSLLTNTTPLMEKWDQIAALLLVQPFTTELSDWFKDWRRGADSLRKRRNEVVHSLWWPTNDTDSPFVAIDVLSRRARDGARIDVVPGGAKVIRELAHDIARSTIFLTEWTADVMGPVMKASKG